MIYAAPPWGRFLSVYKGVPMNHTERFLLSHPVSADCQTFSLEGHFDTLFPVVEQPSMEGFMDMLKAAKLFLFDRKPSVGKITGGWSDRTAIMRKTLNKTYLNHDWLARRRFVEGNIASNKFIAPITNRGTWDPNLEPMVTRYHSVMSEIIKTTELALVQYLGQWSEVLRSLPDDIEDFTHTNTYVLERHIGIHALPSLTYRRSLDLGGMEIIDNKDLVEPQYNLTLTSAVQIPALTAEQVVVAAQAIMTVADILDEINVAWDRTLNNSTYRTMVELIEETEGYDDEASIDSSLVDELNHLFTSIMPNTKAYYGTHYEHGVWIIKSLAQAIDASVR